MKRWGVWLFVTAVLIFRSVATTGAPAPNVTGQWAGYFDSSGDRFGTSGVRGALSIQISSQDGRRFAGEVCFPPDPCTPVMGTIAESGEMTMTGGSSGLQHIEVHVSPFDGLAGLVNGNYHGMRAGALDQGNIVLVHQSPGDGVPADVAGMWGGHATPLGTAAARPILAIIETDSTGAISGTFGWEQPEARSQMVGQAMSANGADHVAIAGLLDGVLVVADFVSTVPPTGGPANLDGIYQLIDNARASSQERGIVQLWPGAYAQVSKQCEAVANLKAMFTVEKGYFQEKDAYDTHIDVVGFEPERFNRYRYVLTADPVSIEDRSTTLMIKSYTDQGVDADVYTYPLLIYPKITSGPCIGGPAWGITGNSPVVFTGAAYGDIDGDSTLDVWTISTYSRFLSGSDCDAVGYVPSGEPSNDHNDVNH